MPWTVIDRSEFEPPPVKGSRFLATVAPATTPAEALAVVEALQQRFPRAHHHCWAFVLADGVSRCSDDGEPSGSAGRPILARIEGREAQNIVVVVTRWFGGTKLGVGGLVRAYGGSAGQGLDSAEPVEMVVHVTVDLTYSYADTGAVDSVLNELGIEDSHTEYGAMVRRRVALPPEHVDRLRHRLTEATAGRVAIEGP